MPELSDTVVGSLIIAAALVFSVSPKLAGIFRIIQAASRDRREENELLREKLIEIKRELQKQGGREEANLSRKG